MKNAIRYFSLGIGTIIFAAVFYFIGFSDVISSFRISDWSSFFLYIAVSILIFVAFVVRWDIILRMNGFKVPFFKLFNYRVAGFGVSYMTPSARLGGEPVRVYFLTKHNIPVEKAMASVFIDKSLEVVANFTITAIGIFLFMFLLVLTPGLMWMMTLVFIITVGAVWVFFDRIYRGKGVFTSIITALKLNRIQYVRDHFYKVREAENEMTRFFVFHKKEFIISMTLSFVIWTMSILEFKFLLSAFGVAATIKEVFLVLLAIGIAYIIPVPTALGVLEGFQVSLFKILNKGAKYGLAVSLATRVRDMMWAIYGLTYLYIQGVVVKNLLTDKASDITVSEKVKYFRKWKVK